MKKYKQLDLNQSHGISLSTLQYWFRKTDREKPSIIPSEPPDFIPLQITPDQHPGIIEIVYPDGPTVLIQQTAGFVHYLAGKFADIFVKNTRRRVRHRVRQSLGDGG